ncbi:class I SAM-dependent methyltransferase [Oscillatoria sp. FACHB-1406]|uniref:class I SAM-dependent methyltransferase n=1 Tax=Oscillatoria sp. FACHB-1406 TaxID=2692846 RepID=UPI001685A92A|nr:class I SAM-dependent methyltransferase [Oscillatoria sp. FACHB-1406]MBD2578955.1 class I SAM-dependent methyltransferase [Oscillatoria sp. FACHB-1406]
MSEPSELPRQKVQRLAAEAIARSDPSGWFEVMYAEAEGDPQQVPWARLTPHPTLQEWLEATNLSGAGKSALVIGCGLGDDAEALSKLGFAVTAFDISPSAIAWCKQRFPHSKVHYIVADLFKPDPAWNQAFDLVVEIRNLQALPIAVRSQALAEIASAVDAGGTLFLVTRFRDTEAAPEGPPWPLSENEIAQFQQLGLTEIERRAFDEGTPDPIPHLQILFRQLDFNRVWLTQTIETRQGGDWD